MLRFDDKVAIVTGAGQGLGRSHAVLLASRGAKVVVNDLGGSATGEGKSGKVADEVVAAIESAGGRAVANYDSVEDGARIVEAALDAFGRIDIVVNNAGILRDTSFHKMTPEDWDLIYRVHVKGSFAVTHAAWPHLRDQGFGRVVMTASAAGIYGNFGQANYAMAKLGLAGFANTLAVEGRKKNVHVNTIAPIAGSRLTETVLPKEITDALRPEYVSPLVAWLCHEDCEESGGLFEVGGGYFGKLRWERAKGRMFRLGRAISPEDVKTSWTAVTSFEESEHPTDISASMQPIMQNIQAGPSKGGNEFIDVDQALGFEFPEWTSRYDERDLAIYALGVGAAADPLDAQELSLVYEMSGDGFKALPTYGVIPAVNGILDMAKKGITAPGMRYGLDRVLHGEQYTRLVRPLPPKATLTHKSRIKDIFDKGKGALVVSETKTYDEDGDLLIVNENTVFVRGAGGWGGDRGPSADVNTPPDRAPDQRVEQKIDENQALLYRLSGDWNPLHADPNFAKAFGYERPILHGLCTYGYAARHVLRAFAKDRDPRYFESIKVRFAKPVFPGETLVTEMWKESETRIVFQCSVKERGEVVLSNAAIALYEQIPKKVAKAPEKSGALADAGPAEVIPADVFHAVGAHVAAHPELAKKVQKIFLWKVEGGGEFTMNLKDGHGSVAAGKSGTPDCTLEIAASDFIDMCTGKADAQKLYFGGKLKISGDVMASQKLTFLKDVDPKLVQNALAARLTDTQGVRDDVEKQTPSGGGGAPSSAPATRSAAGPSIFDKLSARLSDDGGIAAEVRAVIQFRLIEPESAWLVDLSEGHGAVKPGTRDGADVVFTLKDEDLEALTRGDADMRDLHQRGALRVDGDVRLAQRLSFLKGLA
jgi:3-hydroxyacyl-CoA dehydrogenase/3a,7a,12a-trihydroxy-5b-cholest-24-enoyl-CoA hydratase